MNEFRIHGVYIKVPLQECWDATGQGPIGTKWIDINKGDKLHPEYRSRLVGQEIKMDKRSDLFAATPPIEALRCLLAAAAYDYGIGIKGIKLDFYDVSGHISTLRLAEKCLRSFPQRIRRRASAAS